MGDADDPVAVIDGYLQRFAEEREIEVPPLSAEGIGHVQRGSAVVSIHVVPQQDVLLLLSRIMPIPEDNREACFQRLLELSFLTTRDAAFAIDAGTGSIYLRCLRGLDGLSYEEFEDLVHTIADIADEWDDRLHAEFGR